MILWVILSVVVLLVSGICTAGWVGRNPLVGIRIPATRQSDEAWRAGHRAALLPAVVGTIAIGVAFGFSAGSADDSSMTIVAIVLFAAELIWVVVAAQRAASRVLPDL